MRMAINFDNIRQAEGILDELTPLKTKIEEKINLSRTVGNEKRATLTGNKIMRICLIAGLALNDQRKCEDFDNIQL